MNKSINDKTLQTMRTEIKYVIVTRRDGIMKYISKDYGYKHKVHYSVKMNKAKRFDSVDRAYLFMHNYNINPSKCQVCQMECNYRVAF